MWLFWISDLIVVDDSAFDRMYDIQVAFVLTASDSRPKYMAWIQRQTELALEL